MVWASAWRDISAKPPLRHLEQALRRSTPGYVRQATATGELPGGSKTAQKKPKGTPNTAR
eukprot:4525523-Pyramimonas_sp.AAC.1